MNENIATRISLFSLVNGANDSSRAGTWLGLHAADDDRVTWASCVWHQTRRRQASQRTVGKPNAKRALIVPSSKHSPSVTYPEAKCTAITGLFTAPNDAD